MSQQSSVDVDLSGPLFDGSALRSFDRMEEEIKEATAQVGIRETASALESVMQSPTGFYVSQLQTERRADDVLVTDGGVVYGPWLAGVDSRNRSSRFKGYTHWRKAAQRTEAKVDLIAAPILARRIQEMNR
jgi:hypothetical protein